MDIPWGSYDLLAKASVAVVLFYVARAVITGVSAVYAFMLRPGKNLRRLGKWAIVTGATDGIGEAIAMELAKKGMSILLISRTPAKLKATQEAILKKTNGKVEVTFLAVDFSDFNAEKQALVKGEVAKMSEDGGVGVLVNNVGMSYSFCRYFHELTMEEANTMVEMNVNSTSRMTHIVLGNEDVGMLSRKSGAIVNMSSAAARNPSPLLAQYSGTKGYIEHFSGSMNSELKSKGIHVQSQTPLFVRTKLEAGLGRIKKPTLTTPSPKNFAKASVAHIGYETWVSPYWSHALQLWVFRMLPPAVFDYLISGLHHKIRKGGMRKLEKMKAEASNKSK